MRAEIGCGRKPRHRGGPPGVVEKVANRDLSPSGPNCVASACIGGINADACCGLEHSLRSGQLVHQQRLAIAAEAARQCSEHEPARKLSRQYSGRELLQYAEEGMDQATDLPGPGRSSL